MTREEQMQNYAYNNCITEDVDDSSYSLIVDAIKWADETMIDKACKWLRSNTYKHIDDKYLTMSFNTTIEMIEEFRKAMEE